VRFWNVCGLDLNAFHDHALLCFNPILVLYILFITAFLTVGYTVKGQAVLEQNLICLGQLVNAKVLPGVKPLCLVYVLGQGAIK